MIHEVPKMGSLALGLKCNVSVNTRDNCCVLKIIQGHHPNMRVPHMVHKYESLIMGLHSCTTSSSGTCLIVGWGVAQYGTLPK